MDNLVRRFAGRYAPTLALVIVEAGAWVCFPLVIGRAVDSVLEGSSRGLAELGVLGIFAMGVAVVRRLVDSRAFASIYATLGEEMVSKHAEAGTSTKTARLSMLREVVEFFEHSVPELLISLLGLVGTVAVLSALNTPIFLASLVATAATATLYALTGGLATRYNAQFNDELERRVDVVESGDSKRVAGHLRRTMRWNIRLSDLEAANFGVNWIFMMALLVYSVAASADGEVAYGAIIAVVMYVFQFMESMMQIPFYYQGWLRLREILGRLRAGAAGG